MNVLVTGSEGFIGSNLTQYASPSEFEFIRCDIRPKPGVIQCDLTKGFPELPKRVDACIHLASHNIESIGAGSEVEATVNNLRIIDNVIKGCHANGIKLLVNASSSSVYRSSNSPLLEIEAGSPTNAYGFSQLQVEHACSAFSKELGLPILSVRLFNVLGFHQKTSMFPWKVMQALDSGRSIDLYGDSFQSWTYVRPVIDFLQACAKTGFFFGNGHHVFNYGSELPVSQEEMLLQIARLLGKTPHYTKLDRRHSDVSKSVPSMIKTLQVFGPAYKPTTNLTVGLQELVSTYAHTRANLATSFEEYDQILKRFSSVPKSVPSVSTRA